MMANNLPTWSAQVLAALAYSRNTPGVWFVNPEAWITDHLFKKVSIWDVPLVKPPFSCGVDPAVLGSGADVADALDRSLRMLSTGGACEDGLIHVDVDPMPSKSYQH